MAEAAPPKRDADVRVLPLPEPSIDHSPHLWKFTSTDLLQIYVGSQSGVQRIFNVHEGLLKSQSLFFRGMLRNNFPETRDRVIRLPDDDVRTFAVFLQWLYTGKSPVVTSIFRSLKLNCPFKRHEAHLLEPKKKGASSSVRLLFSSYIFADKIQAPWFKNHIHNQLIAGVTSVPCPLLTVGDIRYVYANTQDGEEEDSLLRLCCLAISCGPNLDSLLEDPEFLELCFEVKSFGVRVLKRCRTRITAPAAAPKPKGRKRG
ncbi:uncharacterized protein BDCG_05872 [Blastomyces dermatitidis ER-3]|uniref:BTB domain-containing protein n=1 Tax=Ajellomyces dermatitidis (strain ER-3 / ATCC MYA-2586) TaxID=559297 RepID=A0ABP2F5Z2_AJEDR|nr:uncharacterized protein BDCG_05872 [Blastomyces dermatitidis ER-3]EEQ90752.2 hypothetical protein BDCG_05872 [Blastomyces dermatitidis ER-3]EQL36647.1 hypothetical protein BDFG_02009 [Blastomyces dermatitidis ATCC 26199]